MQDIIPPPGPPRKDALGQTTPDIIKPESATPPVVPETPPEEQHHHQPSKKQLIAGCLLALIILVLGGVMWVKNHSDKKPVTSPAISVQKQASPVVTSSSPGIQLDTKKQYGNKYASGILPVGDNHYSTTEAKVGSIYACSQYASSFSQTQGGAGNRGPWFTNSNTSYDINKKLKVQGTVSWQPSFSNIVSNDTRTILTNDLPNHTTGTFPISSTDPAYAYDRNPNSIKGQTLTYILSASPSYSDPKCMGGEVGVMLSGVALFSAFDAGGRDAGAWEVQDSCNGHPQNKGEYHYHSLSACIKDTSVHSVIGYALDGYPITGPQVSAGNYLTTSDLDVCHGLTSTVTIDGKTSTTYHYVMTQDFPYSISCFRSNAIQPPR